MIIVLHCIALHCIALLRCCVSLSVHMSVPSNMHTLVIFLWLKLPFISIYLLFLFWSGLNFLFLYTHIFLSWTFVIVSFLLFVGLINKKYFIWYIKLQCSQQLRFFFSCFPLNPVFIFIFFFNFFQFFSFHFCFCILPAPF